jgi:Helix-turn-helix domain
MPFCWGHGALSLLGHVGKGGRARTCCKAFGLAGRGLLATSRMTVEQIAEQVGYSDATALRRMMRKLVGATPRQFRPTAYEAYS